jgi:hypothetical protein
VHVGAGQGLFDGAQSEVAVAQQAHHVDGRRDDERRRGRLVSGGVCQGCSFVVRLDLAKV